MCSSLKTIVVLVLLRLSAGLQFHQQMSTEPEQQSNIRYGVHTAPYADLDKRIGSQLDTWMKNLAKDAVYIIGHDPLEGKEDGATWNSAKECNLAEDERKKGSTSHNGKEFACQYATMMSDAHDAGSDWLVILDDDQYVNTDNVQKRLDKLDPNKPQMLGMGGCSSNTEGKKCEGQCGGGGQIISRGALEAMSAKGREGLKEMHGQMTNDQCNGWPDIATTMLGKVFGVESVDLGLGEVAPWRPPEDDPMSPDRLDKEFDDMLIYHKVVPDEMYQMGATKKKHDAAHSSLLQVRSFSKKVRSSPTNRSSYKAYVEKMNKCRYSKSAHLWIPQDCE